MKINIIFYSYNKLFAIKPTDGNRIIYSLNNTCVLKFEHVLIIKRIVYLKLKKNTIKQITGFL